MESASPVLLADVGEPSVEAIGGKAASLVRLSRAGFRVPEAAVLPATWFSTWWAELEKTEAWSGFVANPGKPWTTHCDALKAAAGGLAFSREMRAGLEELHELLGAWGPGATAAVRSSSPDEDLASASFAGGYVTVLGVRAEGIEDAVRACFVSCLDERVALYKEQHGFDVHRPRIAVLVQHQVESDVSGVGFSLNPVTNDYDEAVIDASFGLGETVVSGEVSPDHFIVDKPGRKILSRELGSKSVSRWIRPDGGVELREEERASDSSLEDAQVLELTDALVRLEAVYGLPVDIEWAYTGRELHLLQARPVTTYFPLAPDMQTEPGAPRRLYMDGSLSDAITSNAPITALTLSGYEELYRRIFAKYGLDIGGGEDPTQDLLVFRSSRMYVGFSDLLWFASPRTLATRASTMDALLVRTLENLDRERYRPKAKPAWLAWRRLPLAIFRVLFGMRSMLWGSVVALCSPSRCLRRFRAADEQFQREARAAPADSSIAALLDLNERSLDHIMNVDIPPIAGWFGAVGILALLEKRADDDTRELLARMTRGIEGELVIEMGIEMFAASRLLEPGAFDDLPRLAERIASRDLPSEFLAAWDGIVERFGVRAPNEMDLASPRYGEDPLLLLRQLSFMTKGSPDDPRAAHERHVAERREAFAELSRRFGWYRRALLRLAHRWTEAFAGERDTAKFHWVLGMYTLRRTALARGDRLVSEGRLDAQGDVFHLTFDELAKAEKDATFDVRTPAAARRGELENLAQRAREFPHLIDSRGRIQRPAPTDEADALTGLGISPGLASGPIKVLENPYDKDVEPGDVLVAYTTDPGWTPLFINASAIILQVGGMMQHGGVVAREYGKPCVAGIEHVLTRFEDGQQVEVDGSAGVVRLL